MARRSRSKSGIRINPKYRGAFARKGISVSQGLRSKNPRTRAQANFARMAKRGFKPLKSSTRSHRVRGHIRVTSTGRRVRVKPHRRG